MKLRSPVPSKRQKQFKDKLMLAYDVLDTDCGAQNGSVCCYVTRFMAHHAISTMD